MPDPLTVATDGLAEVQLPPVADEASTVVAPIQTLVVPEIVPGTASGLTVMARTAVSAPQLLLLM